MHLETWEIVMKIIEKEIFSLFFEFSSLLKFIKRRFVNVVCDLVACLLLSVSW